MKQEEEEEEVICIKEEPEEEEQEQEVMATLLLDCQAQQDHLPDSEVRFQRSNGWSTEHISQSNNNNNNSSASSPLLLENVRTPVDSPALLMLLQSLQLAYISVNSCFPPAAKI